MSGLYLVWRCVDTKGRPPVVTDSRNSRASWRKGKCSECEQPVWFHHAHIEDRRLVCWSCAQKIGVAHD